MVDILETIQSEIGEWAKQQFGDNPSKHPLYEGAKLFSIPSFLGMVEEIGELAGPQAKLHQGRYKHNDVQYYIDLKDGLADLLIFACDFANREGINLAGALHTTWETVKKRRQASWNADKANEEVKTSQNIADQISQLKICLGQENLIELAKSALQKGWRIQSLYGAEESDLYLYPPLGHRAISSCSSWRRKVIIGGQEVRLPDYIEKVMAEDYVDELEVSEPYKILEVTNQGFAEPPEEKELPEVVVRSFQGLRQRLRKPLDNSYTKYCEVCNFNRVHNLSTSSICADCMSDKNGGR